MHKLGFPPFLHLPRERPILDMEEHARNLLKPELSVQERSQMVYDIRDSLEIVHTGEYLKFLKCYFRSFLMILTHMTSPQFTDTEDHRLRNTVIDLLNRLPKNEVLRSFVQDLMRLAMQVLNADNEENGIICICIILDLLKNYRTDLENDVQPFLNFVCKIYLNFRETMNHFFVNRAIGTRVEYKSQPLDGENAARGKDAKQSKVDLGFGQLNPKTSWGELSPSIHSFKIVTECPLVVLIIFNLYGRLVQTNIPHLLPKMIAIISVPEPEKVPCQLKKRVSEFKVAQVKTVSFLTYLLRGFFNYMKSHEEGLSKSIVNLLVTGPDSPCIRKELLIALKAILSTDSRRALFPLIDTLLEERVLVGNGRSCFESLRPLANNILAEITHLARGELSHSQLSRIIYLFSSKMHDASLPLNNHITCARLLLNLVGTISEKGVDQSSMDEARKSLVHILDAFVGKFCTLKCVVPQAVLILGVPSERLKEVNDTKSLIKTLVIGIRTIIWSITYAHLPRAQVSLSERSTQSGLQNSSSVNMLPLPEAFKGMKEDELQMVSRMLKSGIRCLALFKEKDEEKEMMNLFSQILTIMEPRDLMDVLVLCMTELFEVMVSNIQFVHIYSTILQSPKFVRPFATVLANYLVNRKIDVLRHPDTPAAKLVLHLFQILFAVVVKVPECECILCVHVPVIMDICMKKGVEGDGLLYMQLLLIMFRALKEGKFEILLHELIPKLHPSLDILLPMIVGPIANDMKDLVLELCLTLPARLSSLLQHLPRLMKPLLLTLKGSTEMVKLGLETLEFWIDNLNPYFLEESMAGVMSDLVLVLWSHLRPAPYPMGKKALVLLGKLGGRNRCFLKEPLTLECKENHEHGLRFILTFEPTTTFLVPLDRCISLAVASLLQNSVGMDVYYRKQALKFVRVCLSSQLNLRGDYLPGEGVTPGVLATYLVSSVVTTSQQRTETSNEKADLGVKTIAQHKAERSVFKVLLRTLIAASAEPDLQDPQDDFLVNVCRHFAMVFHVDYCSTDSLNATGFQTTMLSSSRHVNSGSGSISFSTLKVLDPLIFLDALVDVLADENSLRAKAALVALNELSETLILLAGTKHNGVLPSRGSPGTLTTVASSSSNPVYVPLPSVQIPVFEQLLHRLVHCCYGSTQQAQSGGVIGLGALIGKVTVKTLYLFQERIVHGLIYVLKTLPRHAKKEQEETSQVLTRVLSLVNNIDEAHIEAQRQSFKGVLDILATELFNANASIVVRKNVESCLTLLASRSGSEVSELLEPVYRPLLRRLIMRPLRSKNVEQQVATVTSLNYCLGLRPPLLNLTPELVTILQEVLQIAEAEDVCFGKSMNLKTDTSAVTLKTTCIELLCTAITWPTFRSKTISILFMSLTSQKPEIAAVAKEGLRQVIQQQGMSKDLLMSNVKPMLYKLGHMEDLRRPVLQGLACLLELLPTWFSVAVGDKLLEHLKKLMELDKLARCQKSWKAGDEPKIAAAIIELFHMLPPKADRFLDDLVTLTIDLEGVLSHGQFFGAIDSPYYLPLTKFLNRFATNAVDYFLVRLDQLTYFRRFMCIICSDDGLPLREELAKSPQKILSSAFPQFFSEQKGSQTPGYLISYTALMNDEGLARSLSSDLIDPLSVNLGSSGDAYFRGLNLISTLVKLLPEWLQTNRVVFDTLVLLWKSPARIARLHNERELSLVEVKESKWLVKCFLNYIRHDKTEVDVPFHMLSIFLAHSRIDYTFLKQFYTIEVAEGYPPSLKKLLLLHFLQLFEFKQLTQDHLVVSMQMLILPMLSHAFKNGQTWEVVDPSIIKTIFEKLLDPPEQIFVVYDEPLRIELLQLATLLVKHLQNHLINHRKELIKLCWTHIKSEDSVAKQWAFVTVCYFFQAFQAPEKTIYQVYVSLLRSCEADNKVLAQRALDTLIPLLQQKFAQEDVKMPTWIRFIKKLLAEEGHSLAILVHLFQLINRHPNLFYAFRAQFVPLMVNSLSRLGLPDNNTIEYRRLAIEIAGLVVCWERQRRSEVKVLPHIEGSDAFHEESTDGESKCPRDGTVFPDDITTQVHEKPGPKSLYDMSPGPSSVPKTKSLESAGQPDGEFKPTAAMEGMIINFLIRVALVIETKDKESTLVYKKALQLLSEALVVWPNANVKFNYLETLLSRRQPSHSKDPANSLSQGLAVMTKILEKQPSLFIRNNVNQLSQIVGTCFNNKMLDDGMSMCSMLKMVFVAFPLDATTTPLDVKMLYQMVQDLLQKHLSSVISPQLLLEVSNTNSITSFIINVIKSLTEVQKNFADPFVLPLARVLLHIERDMSSSAGSDIIDPDSAVSPSPAIADTELMTSNFKDILTLISKKVVIFPECMRSLSEILNKLLSEKGTDDSVLLCILDVIKAWSYGDVSRPAIISVSSVLAQEEIVSYLQKLSQVDKQNFSSSSLEEWDRKYLGLLYGICADLNKYPIAVRQEVFEKVEMKFMLGLRANDPEIRQSFFSLYNEYLEKRLFTRLQYIINVQDWEALSNVFWLKQGLDLLMAVLVESMPIELAPNSAQMLPLVASSFLPDCSMLQEQINSASEESECPLTFDSLVRQHTQFLKEMSKLQVPHLIAPLRELSHADANVAYHMWVLIFPIVWAALTKDEQLALAKPLRDLLAKDYHTKQRASRPNVVQALLEGIELCRPQPQLPSGLIKYTGKTFNAWHTSLALLESQLTLQMNDTKCSEALAELYYLLNEDDMRYGLWKKRSVTDETRVGLSLIQHGYWQHAQNLFYQAMTKVTRGSHNKVVPKAEMCFWEEQWLYCASQLSQWDALIDFGKSVGNYEMLLDCLWKAHDWTYLKENIISKAQIEDTPKLHLVQAYLALHDRNTNGVNDAGKMALKSIDLALEQWRQLPDMSFQSRIPLLQQFQQIVEVQESARMIENIATCCMQIAGNSNVATRRCMDLQGILETWRLRTPNAWDNFTVWYDLLQGRNGIYNIVIDLLKDINHQLHHLAYRDKAWNVNMLAHIARKQGLHDVCISILEKLYGYSTMELQEAFSKVREQAKAYLEMKGELVCGLNLISSTNLEYFPLKHKAEIFRLRGDFLLKLSDYENANLAYSNAISLFKHLPKGWISWGSYCDMVYKETNEEVWLEYAASCFFQAIKYGVSNSRSHIAHVLYLLSFDTVNKPVGKAFDKYLDQIPHWVWLSWIPQLLLSLQRSEAPHCKLVLLKIAVVYPQALYYSLRMFVLEHANKTELGKGLGMNQQGMQKNVYGAGGETPGMADGNGRVLNHIGGRSTSDSPQGPSDGLHVGTSYGQEHERSTSAEGNMHVGPSQRLQQSSSAAAETVKSASGQSSAPGSVASGSSSLNAAKDILDALKRKHSSLASELEILLMEICSRFVILPEERLLAVVNTLLDRCYKYPSATTAEVPQPLKKELSGVCKAFFSADVMNKNVDFVREYRRDFVKDLDPNSTDTFPTILLELSERLKRWKTVLQSNVEARFPTVLKLEEESKLLLDFHAADVEIPGQYYTNQETAPDHTVKLDRVGADIAVVRRHGTSYRRLTLIGSDGSRRYFIVQTSPPPNAQSDERLLQLFRVMNRMFDKHKESRRRHLYLHTPVIVPVWHQVRMVEDDLTYSSFLEVYELNCAQHNREVDLPIMHFKEQLKGAFSGQISPEAVVDLRLQAYNDITKDLVGDNIFSQYMYKTLLSRDLLWQFKRQFGVQIGLSCFISFMLQIGGRSPNKILFSKNTGKIFQMDFHPVYDVNGVIESNEPVPFRFTRNMHLFFSHFGVEGPIISAMCAAVQAVISPKKGQHIWYHLAMFFRDEILSRYCKRPYGIPSTIVAPDDLNPPEFKHKITRNVEYTIGRIRGVGPEAFLEEEGNPMDPPQSVQSGVTELVEAASSPRNLCMMDPTWHPWY